MTKFSAAAKKDNRGTILTFWGSPGSGKSTLSALLSGLLSDEGCSVILISPDSLSPMLSVWRPEQWENGKTLGALLDTVPTDAAAVSPYLHYVRGKENIGILACGPGETPYSHAFFSTMQGTLCHERVRNLLRLLSTLSDFVIADCISPVNDWFTLTALENADLSILLLTPDRRGLSYGKTALSVISEARLSRENERFFFANGTACQTGWVERELGRRSGGMLTHKPEIAAAAAVGDCFSPDLLRGSNRKILAQIADAALRCPEE